MAVEPTQDTSETYSFDESPPYFRDWRGGRAAKELEQADEDDLRQRTGTAPNWTTFDLKDATAKLHDPNYNGTPHWERLDDYNCDRQWRHVENERTSAALDRQFKKYLINAFCCQLELNAPQRQRAFEWLMSIRLSRTGMPAQLTAFLICALVVNEDAVRYGDENVYHPNRSMENNDQIFLGLDKSLLESYGRITKRILTSYYNKLLQDSLPKRDPEEWKLFHRHDLLTPQDPNVTPSFNLEMTYDGAEGGG